MARPWTSKERESHCQILQEMYVEQNKSIREIGNALSIAQQTVFKRLGKCAITTVRHTKPGYCNKRWDVHLPIEHSEKAAEFMGIMLGDGHVSPFQVKVTLGNKELEYVHYVQKIMNDLFGIKPTIHVRKTGYRDVYIGSSALVNCLVGLGLVQNKVKSQVDIPAWLFEHLEWKIAFVRGFFDTDGSVYAIRYGVQISFTNASQPLLRSLHTMLQTLGYTSSAISSGRIYITRRGEVSRFFSEIRPANIKHRRRFKESVRVGTQVVNEDRL